MGLDDRFFDLELVFWEFMSKYSQLLMTKLDIIEKSTFHLYSENIKLKAKRYDDLSKEFNHIIELLKELIKAIQKIQEIEH